MVEDIKHSLSDFLIDSDTFNTSGLVRNSRKFELFLHENFKKKIETKFNIQLLKDALDKWDNKKDRCCWASNAIIEIWYDVDKHSDVLVIKREMDSKIILIAGLHLSHEVKQSHQIKG